MIPKMLFFHLLCLALAQVDKYTQDEGHSEINEDGKVAENSTKSDVERTGKWEKHHDDQLSTRGNNNTGSDGENDDSEEGSIIYDREWGKDYYEPLLTHGDHFAEKDVEDYSQRAQYEQQFTRQNHSAKSEVEDHSERSDIIDGKQLDRDYYHPLFIHIDQSANSDVEKEHSAGIDAKEDRKRGHHHYEQLLITQGHSAGREVEDHSRRSGITDGKQLDRDYYHPLLIDSDHSANSDVEEEHFTRSAIKDDRKRDQHHYEQLLITQGHSAGRKVEDHSGRSGITDGKQLDRDYYYPLLIDSDHSRGSSTEEEHSAGRDVEEEHTTRGHIKYDQQWERDDYKPLLNHDYQPADSDEDGGYFTRSVVKSGCGERDVQEIKKTRHQKQ